MIPLDSFKPPSEQKNTQIDPAVQLRSVVILSCAVFELTLLDLIYDIINLEIVKLI